MFVPSARLFRRGAAERDRRAELLRLRRRFADERRLGSDSNERAMARRMRELRAAVSEALSGVASCGGCSRGLAAPEGAFDGGYCCSVPTENVFSADEVAALYLGGTRPGRLRPARAHAGCAFRGARGCTLDAVDRPDVCAIYLCGELRRELHRRAELLPVLDLIDELEALLRDFSASRARRRERAELAAIHPLLAE